MLIWSIMDRRSFLKSIGAAGLLPVLPIPSFTAAAPAAVPAVSAHTYQWAEMIVRAHNKCNLGLLQRSLHISEAAASHLKSQLIKNGVVSAQANAYGIHTATKPLYEGAFMNVSDAATRTAEAVKEFADSPDTTQPVEEGTVDKAQDREDDKTETVVDAPESDPEETIEGNAEVSETDEPEAINSDTTG